MFYFWTMLFSFSLYSLRFDGIVQPTCWRVAEIFQKPDFLKRSYAECQLGTKRGFPICAASLSPGFLWSWKWNRPDSHIEASAPSKSCIVLSHGKVYENVHKCVPECHNKVCRYIWIENRQSQRSQLGYYMLALVGEASHKAIYTISW